MSEQIYTQRRSRFTEEAVEFNRARRQLWHWRCWGNKIHSNCFYLPAG